MEVTPVSAIVTLGPVAVCTAATAASVYDCGKKSCAEPSALVRVTFGM